MLQEDARNKIVIYGIGSYAYDVTLFLRRQGYASRIICYIVSDENYENYSYMNRRVYPLSQAYDLIKESILVLAMKAEYAEQVLEQVQKLRAKEIVNYTREQREVIVKYNNLVFETFSKLPVIRTKVFIDCFDGQGYQCNCKYIVQYMLEHKMNVDIVWNEEFEHDYSIPSEVRCVKRYSNDYFYELYTSGIVICNDEVHDLRKDHRDKQYVINTWHGAGPFKRDYLEIDSEKNNVEMKERVVNSFGVFDLFLSNCSCNTEKYKKAFLYDGEIMECGAPRNDVLFCDNNCADIRKRLGIDNTKKIVLYAPTFRKEVEKSISVYNLDFERISQALSKRFDGEFLVLYRFHHMLYETNYNYECIPMGINVSSYPDVMELLLISDVLITDYSSIMWDFSLMRRPVFLYHNDIEEYDRGFYCDPDEWPYPKAKTSDEMVSKINNFDEEQYVKDLGSFFQRFHSFDDGHASECIVNRIVDVMSNPSKYGKK